MTGVRVARLRGINAENTERRDRQRPLCGAAVLYFKNQGTLTFYSDSGRRLLELPDEGR